MAKAGIIRPMSTLSRREALVSLPLIAEFLMHAQGLAAQAPAAAPAPPVFVHDLPNVSLDGWEVTVSHVDYPPGRVGTEHHHAGFVLAYVLQGAIVTQVSGQGGERALTAGQMFYEQPGATHEVSRNASQTEPARLLAMIFAKKGSTLTTQGRA